MCDLVLFIVFMKKKKMLFYNLGCEEFKCNFLSYLNGKQIIDVLFYKMSCSILYGKYNVKICYFYDYNCYLMWYICFGSLISNYCFLF